MIIPDTTKTQKHILYLLYKFRFLTTHHIQKLLNHKNPKRIQIWMKDLKNKGFINTVETPNSFIDNTKPFIYHLSTKARHVLKNNEDCTLSVLTRIYKEKKRTETFIYHSLALADTYLFFLQQKEENEELHFFTESELVEYDYFPDPLPCAYIAVTTENSTRRYFLELFYDYAPAPAYRSMVIKYLKYANSRKWEAKVAEEPLPSILFICATGRKKKHVTYFAKALFEKAYEEKIALFVTTKEKIIYGNDKNVWENVSITDA